MDLIQRKAKNMNDVKTSEKMRENAPTEEPMLFEEKAEKKNAGWRRLVWMAGLCAGVFFFWPRGGIQGDAVLQASKFVKLEVTSPGILKELHYEKGASVKKGAVIARFENPQIVRNLEEKEQSLEIASHDKVRLQNRTEFLQKEKERMGILYENGAVGRDTCEKADFELLDVREELAGKEQEIKSLEGEIRFLKERIEALVLKAPFDGVLLNDPKDRLGGFFREGDLVLEMADPQSYFLELLALEKDVKKIKAGNKVRARFYAYPKRWITGEVVRVAPRTIEQVEKVFKVRRVISCEIELSDLPPDVRYGMLASVRIDTNSPEKIIQSRKDITT
ncbi:MAG: HlyD family efflux transporter periplasmic adaptor subunit [Candidatus Omnitrophota bacterium]